MAGEAVKQAPNPASSANALPKHVVDAIAAGKGVVMADGLGGYACAENEDECYRIVRDRNGEQSE